MTSDIAALSSGAPRTARADAKLMNQDQREWLLGAMICSDFNVIAPCRVSDALT